MFAASAKSFGGTLAVMLAVGPAMSNAQEWPAKPTRFIVPAVAGASNDVAARVMAERLAAKWKQPVVVDNRPGAGTMIGTDAVAKAPPDGYTFGWVISAHAVNPSLHAKLPYDTIRDLAGVTLVDQAQAGDFDDAGSSGRHGQRSHRVSQSEARAT